jgi:hypothetical protein
VACSSQEYFFKVVGIYTQILIHLSGMDLEHCDENPESKNSGVYRGDQMAVDPPENVNGTT